MKIIIGSDHAGFELKEKIVDYLKVNYEVVDCGCDSIESVDYPDYANLVCDEVKEDTVGILVCFTGIGMSMAANKRKGIRAALVGSITDAKLTREHNNANVLCLSAKNTNYETAVKIIDTFLNNDFLGGRHERRVNKLMKIENK